MAGQTLTKESEKMDEKIAELEQELYAEKGPRPDFDSRLFEFYPQFIKEDIQKGKCVLLNGIDFEQLGLTDAAYFLSKDPRYIVTQADPEPVVSVPEVHIAQSNIVDIKNANMKKMDIEDVNNKNEYCICRKNQSAAPDDVLIQCDHCSDWYHPFCLKVSRTEVALLNLHDATMKWYCRKCLAFSK